MGWVWSWEGCGHRMGVVMAVGVAGSGMADAVDDHGGLWCQGLWAWPWLWAQSC